MEPQTFNLRENGFFLGTITVMSRTDSRKTATRLGRYIEKRLKRSVTVHPVLNA